eukprot:5906195-Ditylum_brightwellii.AAC.1
MSGTSSRGHSSPTTTTPPTMTSRTGTTAPTTTTSTSGISVVVSTTTLLGTTTGGSGGVSTGTMTTSTGGPAINVIDDNKPLQFPTLTSKKGSFKTWWGDVNRIMASNKWSGLYDHTTTAIIPGP